MSVKEIYKMLESKEHPLEYTVIYVDGAYKLRHNDLGFSGVERIWTLKMEYLYGHTLEDAIYDHQN